jgi:integration host factor subunit beta
MENVEELHSKLLVKSELINRIVTKLPQWVSKDIEIGINQLLEYMSESLMNKKRIEIRGFGSITPRYRAPHGAHNPRTKEKIVTPAKYSVHFKAGKELRDRVNALVQEQTGN